MSNRCRNSHRIRGVPVLLFIVFICSCGGGNFSPGGNGGGSGGSGGGSGGGPGGGGGNFQPRPFPNDFFFRLPNQDGGAWSPFEIYDPALKELFVSNPDLNTIEVYSTVDGHYVGHISVPGPAGLSLLPDDSKLVIGTITPYIYFADPSALHIVSQVPIPVSMLTSAANGTTLMPVMPYAMADASIFVGMGADSQSWNEPYMSVLHLFLYDPAHGTFTANDPGIGEVSGAPPALSLDGKHLLVEGLSTTSLELFLYSTNAHGYVATSGPLLNEGYYFAANADGSQFASVPAVPATGMVTLWDSGLQPVNQFTLTEPISGGAIYSRDSKYLYFMTQSGSVIVLNAQTAVPAGYVGVAVGGLNLPWGFFDVDENYHLFGVAQPGGALILNASQPQSAPSPVMPNFNGNATTEANPNVGPVAAGTQVQFIPAPAASGGSADGISSSMEAYFGVTPATQDVVGPYSASSNGGNFLTATAPAPSSPGAVSVLLTDANEDAVFLPDAYTYGPHLLRVTPNAASSQGGDFVTIYAYGLGFFDLSSIQVTIGGNPVNMMQATLNSYDSVYPDQSVTVPVPKGTPGWADIVLTTPNGTDTLKRGLQYLNVEANVPGGPFTFAVYDATRNRFYLTGAGNTVGVFDAGSQTFLQPLQSPAAVSSGASLQGEALTPDTSKLLVATTVGLVRS